MTQRRIRNAIWFAVEAVIWIFVFIVMVLSVVFMAAIEEGMYA